MQYLAHISEDGKREQTVLEHSRNVARLAGDFAERFQAGTWGYCCGMMHDIGKHSQGFQLRLKGGPPVDHSTAGAKELNRKKGFYALAAYCTAGHHAGLPDGGGKADGAGTASLQGRLKKTVPEYKDYQKEIEIPEIQNPAVKMIGKGGFTVSFFLRMAYSCLVDADFLDTEQFMADGYTAREPEGISEKHLEKLMGYVGGWMENTDRTTVNGRRTEILDACIKMGREKPGVFSLTVPTGGGKTVSSLAFALKHACTYGKERIIYVIPYMNIIEQNAAVFRDILGEDAVLECHSNVEYDDREEFKPMQLAAENFDKPVVVTTNVEFFESLFSNKSSKCRKLHNLANSVIIFDEAQMLPTAYLKPCVRAMAELAVNYGSTLVLCTATQPSLQKFFPEDIQIREICPDVEGQFAFFKRSEVESIGTITEAELAEWLGKEQSALCILNNRKRVQKIYAGLEGDGIYHLSTYMYPEHRKRKLAEIKTRLKEGKRCVVVATSLVEAGVDMDFEKVYRELAGIDSVVQAAGRCNREGKRSLDESRTYVFELCEQMGLPAEQRLPIKVAGMVSKKFGDVSSLQAIESYFKQLHYLKDGSLDEKGMIERFESGALQADYPFASAAKDFKLIEQRTKMVFIGKEKKAAELEKRLCCGERSRKLLRDAGHYSIQIYEKDFEKLEAAGYLKVLDAEIAVLREHEQYREDRGMRMDVDFGEAVFG